jgi:hypothetical protein
MFARAKDSKDAYKENGNDIRIIGTRWGKTKVYQLRSPFCDYASRQKWVLTDEMEGGSKVEHCVSNQCKL